MRSEDTLLNMVGPHPKGPSNVAILADLIEEEEMVNSLPEAAYAMFRFMLDVLTDLNRGRTDSSIRLRADLLRDAGEVFFD
jgi:hypothetical protein